MANYDELRQLFGNGELLNRIEVACIITAEAIRGEDVAAPEHANRLLWAKQAFINPNAIRERMLMALLAANKDAAVSVIMSVPDETIQSLVDDTVNLFADGS